MRKGNKKFTPTPECPGRKPAVWGFTIIFLVTALLLTGYFLLVKKGISRLNLAKEKLDQEIQQKKVLEEIEKEKAVPEATADDNQPAQDETETAPSKHLLSIPFYSQAPAGNWDAFHEDMCEEASLLNAGLYLLEKKLALEKYDQELKAMQEIEKKEIGEWKSTTISEIKKLSDVYFEGKLKSKIISDPTAEDIEAEVASGNPVIVPLAGREVGNPNYTPPGPIYHMLVVKGYDEKFFVTNDVGTRKGNSYVFRKEIIMNKMHDWNEKDIHLGAKRVLVLMKSF